MQNRKQLVMHLDQNYLSTGVCFRVTGNKDGTQLQLLLH